VLDREHAHEGRAVDTPTAVDTSPAQPGLRPEGLSAPSVLSLQRSAGNAAVAGLLTRRRSRPAIQRAITITKVDFNPDIALQLEATEQPIDNAFRDFDIRAADLRTQLLPYVHPDNPQAYPEGNAFISDKRKRQEIHHRVRQLSDEDDFTGGDVPELARALATHLRGNTALTDAELRRFQAAIEGALSAGSFKLGAAPGGLFADIARNATTRSKKKREPSTIQHGQLPGPLQGPVQLVANSVQTRNGQLRSRALAAIGSKPLTTLALSQAAAQDLIGVRTVHTNQAGWLPEVAAPNDAETIEARFLAALPVRVTRALAKGDLTKPDHLRQIRGRVKEAIGDGRRLLGVCWGAYSLNAGNALYPFVEFSVPHEHVSRLIYDYVSGKFYVSFHYRWHEGYNPFFEVQGLQDL
jgi:hypothetical protein